MLTQANRKYQPAPSVPMTVRHWPNHTLTHPPRWCSVDLRDGNQSLATPMNPQRKARMFQMLLGLGFREIEAGFPAASLDDYAFIRHLVAISREEVAIQVLTSARPEHIHRTFAALQGIPRAIVHFYLSTSPVQRRVVFGVDEQTLIQWAITAAELIRTLAAAQPDTHWTFQFSPESFSATEPEFALAICEAVAGVWQPTPACKAIINLPATVEVASPNHYADQIEWFGSHFSRREAVVLSIHPHNDRGCGVAAAELALLAGADRVEGALFGNGERTGNLDLVTLAMNLHSQGIDTGLDFSNMAAVTACYRECTGMDVPPRHPYAGELVFTAFSGSHQDAIRKGLATFQAGRVWQVPYLPIDPRDLGVDLTGVIRVNSQSGKAGAAHLLERERGITLPHWLELEFAQTVQRAADHRGQELTGPQIAALFDQTFLHPVGGVEISGYQISREGECRITLQLMVDGTPQTVTGRGNGPIDAACQAMTGPWQVQRYEERAMDSGSNARALAFITLSHSDSCTYWSGVGIDEDILAASLHALVTAINRDLATQEPAMRKNILAGWQSLHWDAADYAVHSQNQFQQAMERIAAMGLTAGESVLDVGCGDGKITAEVARRVWPGRVLGIDLSPEMVRLARERFPAEAHANLAFAVMDAQAIQLAEPFDRIFSNAALHWTRDHQSVLIGMARSLRPGGRFHLDMGGKGNAAQVFRVLDLLASQPPWSAWIGGLENPYNFPDVEEYRAWMAQSGLTGMVEILPRTYTFSNQESFAGWVRTTWLPYTKRIPAEMRESFVTAVTDSYTTLFPPDHHGVLRTKMARLTVTGERPA